jgi:hypothetical protein
MPNTTAVLPDGPSSSSASTTKLQSLLSQAAYAIGEATDLGREAIGSDGGVSPDLSSYTRQLALTGLEKLAAFCRRYFELPEYVASVAGDDFDRPVLETAEIARELRSCAAAAGDCDPLGPAGAAIALCLHRMAEYFDPTGAERVLVHCHAAEQWLRAKPAKRGR